MFCAKRQLSAVKRKTLEPYSSIYGEIILKYPVFWRFRRLTIGKMRIILFIIRHGHLCLWRKIENGKKIKSSIIRDAFGLKSTSFITKITDDKVIFSVSGYGHGVGMSQYGANGMAKEGYTYDQILKYYYNGIEIVNNL